MITTKFTPNPKLRMSELDAEGAAYSVKMTTVSDEFNWLPVRGFDAEWIAIVNGFNETIWVAWAHVVDIIIRED